jgi:3-phosphoshikimate 1-carboxyvinyltransferase
MIRLDAPSHSVQAVVALPGSKSISNRVLILKTLLKSEFSIQNLSDSQDTKLMQEALQQIESSKTAVINAGHAGTNMRFLTALLAVTDGNWEITGSKRLLERPVGNLVEALNALGARIKYKSQMGYPPLLIEGKRLLGGEIDINASVSSQFVTALLLISPALERGLQIRLQGQSVSRPYITMTIEMLRQLGYEIEESASCITVAPKTALQTPELFNIESDWSSASYWYSICALSKGSVIRLKGLQQKSFQADAVLPVLYSQLGVKSTFNNNEWLLEQKGDYLSFLEYDFTACPDIAQTVAVTCFALGVEARLTGLQTLKIKETDRILALKTELEKLGARVVVSDTSIHIQGKGLVIENSRKQHLLVDTYYDHRMALSFAPLSLVVKGLGIMDEAVINKSYPGFWHDLKNAGFSVNLQP